MALLRNAAWLVSVLGCVLAPAPAPAQTPSATLEGVVHDASDAPLAGVRVTATGLQPGQDHATVSDARGRYRFEGITPGLYVLTSEMTGFSPQTVPGVSVQSGETKVVPIRLDLLTLDDLLKIEVKSASKLDQRTREAPGIVTVIPREQIQRHGWISLNDVLYKQPGFGPAQDYDRRTVGSRGLFEGWNNNHLLHLVDGIPFNDNLYGTAYTWEVTPLVFAKNVEVLRGPGSALYGSYAANGVVQVNTLSAEDLQDKSMARVRAGNEGLRLYEWVGGYGAGRTVSAAAAFGAHETDGNEYASLDGSGRTAADGSLQSFLTNDRRSSRYAWVKLEGDRSLDGLSLQFHDQAWQFQTGHGWLWWVPDLRESMEESRRLVALGYRPEPGETLSQEYVVRWQRHEIDWNTRYYPDHAFDDYYPAGMWEYLDTHADDVFGRAQLAWQVPGGGTLLGGVEVDRFVYGGDREHFSNVDVDDFDGGYPPFPDGRSQRLGAWLDWLRDRPATNVAVFAQYASGQRLSDRVSVTLGARWDRTGFEYNDIASEGRPLVEKSFSRFSPRVAVVVLPNESLALKLLAGQAFRAPTPTELAGAHTFSLASNITELEPEVITTLEAAADWRLSRYLSVRANLFRTRFENQIAYSAANFNLSTNIYTLTTTGAELEALVSRGGFAGFANWSYARRQDEEIIDQTIAPSPDRLTWAPSHRVNLGASYERGRWSAAVSGHYEGAVERRSSDVGVQTLPLNFVDVDVDLYRPRTLDGWVSLDGRIAFAVRRDVTVAVAGSNLLDSDENLLVKVLPFPFDYRQEGRRLWASVQVTY